MNHTCKKCGGEQWSISDKNYLTMFSQCWECDKKDWDAGRLSLADFEARETRALTEPRINTASSAAGGFSL